MDRQGSAVLRPPPGHPKFPMLDAVRGLALLGVVAVHGSGASNALDGSWGRGVYALSAALAMFFVLSGFLLYRPFLAGRLGAAPAIRAGDYFKRRFWRIVPAYFVALTVMSLWPGLEDASPPGVHLYAFLQIYRDETFLDGIPVAWTICVEATFYALLPLIAAALTRLASRRRHSGFRADLAGVLAIVAFGTASRIAVKAGVLPPVAGWALPGLIDWIAMGMALAVVSVYCERDGAARRIADRFERHDGTWWLAAGLMLILIAIIDTRATTTPTPALQLPEMGWTPFVLGHLLAGLLAVAIVVPAVFVGQAHGWARRIMSAPLLMSLGTISYGVYLWHVPLAIPVAGKLHSYDWVIEHAFTPILTLSMLFVGVLAGTLSYYLVELPLLRRHKTRPASRR